MDRISFDIFEPDNKRFHLTPNWIIGILWSTMLASLWIFQGIIPAKGAFAGIWVVLVSLISIYYLFVSFFTYEALNGFLSGKILFENNNVIIQSEVFELQDIDELDLELGDYYGKKPLRLYKSVNPVLSQGVGNYITFTDKAGETHVVYFKLENQNSYLSLTPFVNNAVKLNKMSVHHAIELLGIENVSIN